MKFQIFPHQFQMKIILCYIQREIILNIKIKLYIFDSNVIYEIQCCGSQFTCIAYKRHIQMNFEFPCKKKQHKR